VGNVCLAQAWLVTDSSLLGQMVVGPRHATAFRAFGDRAIVTGYPTARLPALPNGDGE